MEGIEIGTPSSAFFGVGRRCIENGVEGAIMEPLTKASVVVYLGLLGRAQLPSKGDSVFLIIETIRLLLAGHFKDR